MALRILALAALATGCIDVPPFHGDTDGGRDGDIRGDGGTSAVAVHVHAKGTGAAVDDAQPVFVPDAADEPHVALSLVGDGKYSGAIDGPGTMYVWVPADQDGGLERLVVFAKTRPGDALEVGPVPSPWAAVQPKAIDLDITTAHPVSTVTMYAPCFVGSNISFTVMSTNSSQQSFAGAPLPDCAPGGQFHMLYEETSIGGNVFTGLSGTIVEVGGNDTVAIDATGHGSSAGAVAMTVPSGAEASLSLWGVVDAQRESPLAGMASTANTVTTFQFPLYATFDPIVELTGTVKHGEVVAGIALRVPPPVESPPTSIDATDANSVSLASSGTYVGPDHATYVTGTAPADVLVLTLTPSFSDTHAPREIRWILPYTTASGDASFSPPSELAGTGTDAVDIAGASVVPATYRFRDAAGGDLSYDAVHYAIDAGMLAGSFWQAPAFELADLARVDWSPY